MMEQKAKDVVYDALLTGLGYFSLMAKYGVLTAVPNHPSFQQVITSFDNYKSVQLPEGYTWGDFLPVGSPIDNVAEWRTAAIDFLTNPDEYIDTLFEGITVTEDWSTANQGMEEQLGEWARDIAASFNFCFIYDEVWPSVAWNYKTMTSVNDATYIPEVVWFVKQDPPPVPGEDTVAALEEEGE